MTDLNEKPPPEWAKDTLTAFFDDALANQYAVFHHKKAEFSDLVQVEDLFIRFFAGWVDPVPEYPAGFLTRAHSAFRAAAGATVSGQLFEAQALLRLCLENTGYGFYIGSDGNLFKAWLGRHDSEQAKKYVREKFTMTRVNNALSQDSGPLGKAFGSLYERLIDFGAHPNERGYSMSTAVRREPGRLRIETIYLHGDGNALQLALKTAAQVGVCALLIAEQLYSDRFQSLGLGAALVDLKSRH
jgi:hypothetical protein